MRHPGGKHSPWGLPSGGAANVAPVNSFRRSALPVLALFVCASALVVSGCGGTVVDSQKAEDAITQNIEDQTNVQVESVSCPDDVDVKAGNTFECEIKLVNGKGATAELKILNEDADVKIVKLTRS